MTVNAMVLALFLDTLWPDSTELLQLCQAINAVSKESQQQISRELEDHVDDCIRRPGCETNHKGFFIVGFIQ